MDDGWFVCHGKRPLLKNNVGEGSKSKDMFGKFMNRNDTLSFGIFW